MSPPLREELGRIFLRCLAGVLVWWGSADWRLGLITILVLYLFTQLRNLTVLRAWLNKPKQVELPTVTGIWGDVFDGLSLLQRRNRKRKKRLASILSEFQASTAALPDGAVVLGPYGEIVWFNDAAQALLGLSAPQDFGQRVANLVRHPAFTSYFGRDEYPGEVEAPSPVNPGVTLSFRIIPYGKGQRLMIVRDVSEFRLMERARRDFVANASHELRTPLTVLRGYLDVMEPESQAGGGLASWNAPLQEMLGQVTRMEALVNDMLKLARLESDVLQTRQELIEVPRMLERLRQDAVGLSQNRHRFEVEIESDLRLFGRETEVQSIFSNLLGNAVHYTPEGGIVRLRWWGDEQGAHFAVADSGIGIAEEDISRITERFYRVDVGRSRASGGTGLGLSIVKHALEQHEARLQIDSELGVGSTFTCHFPVHRMHRGEQKQPARIHAG